MNNKINILIADNNTHNSEKIKSSLIKSDKVESVIVTADGLDVVEIMATKSIDVLICDVVLPQIDVFEILHRVKKITFEKPPIVIVMSSFNNETLTKSILNLDIDYFMLKPIDGDNLLKRILDLKDYTEPKTKSTHVLKSNLDIDDRINSIMLDIGIPSHIKGYLYLVEGIKLGIQDVSFLGSITKKLYPEIAQKYSTTASRVERAMRHAIEISWNNESAEFLHDVLGYSLNLKKNKPSNSEFISLIVDKLRLEDCEI